jgi:hypothetical protein
LNYLASFRSVAGAAALSIASTLLAVSSAYADPNCHRVDAYWETNFSNLVENLSECDKKSWQKCSQAAAIHYDLNSGSLFQRAQACGLIKPLAPGIDFTSYQDTDSQECMQDRDTLRAAYEIRAQARIACAAARAGGADQQWLDSQCSYYRSQMANYHTPFRNMALSCRINYREVLALR